MIAVYDPSDHIHSMCRINWHDGCIRIESESDLCQISNNHFLYLSGGEKARLTFAKMMLSKMNVLFLLQIMVQGTQIEIG